MLTMDETLAAIKALDTDADILHRACVKIAFPDTETTEVTSGKLARDILEQYTKIVGKDHPKLVDALCTALGCHAALVCKPGHEFVLMKSIAAAIYDQFFETLDRKVSLMAKDDPAAAVKHILTVMEGFVKTEEDK